MKLFTSSLAPLIIVSQLLLWVFFASELRVILLPDLPARSLYYRLPSLELSIPVIIKEAYSLDKIKESRSGVDLVIFVS
jgi:hypothetical protein